ncbi:hypothetical protein PI124_g6028 [Phytophthora idaei]|nr:hypothetical protein PI124_g6028 [Phytophthora idaei]
MPPTLYLLGSAGRSAHEISKATTTKATGLSGLIY